MVLNPASHDADEFKKLNGSIREGLAMARNLQAAMPCSFATRLNGSALSVREVQKFLDSDTALLAYSFEKVPPRRSPGVMLRVVTCQASRDYELPLRGSDLEKQVTVLNQRVLTHSHLWSGLGAELYRECISPARQLLEGKKKLVIVPDGIMSSLPFSLMLDSKGRSLQESFEITYAPSASTWASMKPFSFTGRKMTVRDIQKTPGITGKDCMPLSCFTKDGCAELKVSMPPGTLCHLSAPCQVNGRMPSLTGLYGRNGKATRYDFFSLPAEGWLVMADECTTSLDGLYDGNEVAAFTGPFFQAGASAVLFTLWPTPPAVRKESFACFVRVLEASGSPGEALRSMQAAMRKKYPLPINWAPYVLYGK